ncbi:hypothetical protein HMPREF0179_05151 [Bilophila wadsworthia 3_1_6]|uniref:Uncharacterized protein n=1 Tax=Bilophila wadsworthia (strain 3_1_6) TaxID=563192 RepID=S2LBJ1_BILW3|nr:hypothetical protein HMPREF0179_05151 [Bilophila wadsworthia 3_1_6]
MRGRGAFCKRVPSPTPPPLSLPRLSTLSNLCCQFSRIIYQYKHIVIYK